MPATTPNPAAVHSRVRVAGVLQHDAQLHPITGGGALLALKLQPAKGLPYLARVNLGLDVADHMAAQAELPRLRAGVLVTVAGDGLELRTDHGHAALYVLRARDAVAFFDPVAPCPLGAPQPALEG